MTRSGRHDEDPALHMIDLGSRIPKRLTRQLEVVRGEDRLEITILPKQPEPRGIPVIEIRDNPLARHRPWLTRFIVCTVVIVFGAFVLISAGIYQRGGIPELALFSGGQSFPVQVGGSYVNITTWENSNGPLTPTKPIPTNTGPYSVLGKPTITAAFIDQVLTYYHSPAAGKGQALYDLGQKYGIDPAFALAFFMHESTFGTAGVATVTLSLGNMRCVPNIACYNYNGGYAQFNSWEQGFEAWYKLIRNLYVARWGLVTIDQIIPVYAPSSDHNDEAGYIRALKHTIDTWHAGIVQVS
jgi:Mannosyl-glycoprotein endo-beta-N-acetylglucosaminidase